MPAQNVARPPCVRLTPTSDRAQELVLARAQAITNQVFVVGANAAGPAARGRSVIVDPEGLVRVEAGEAAKPGACVAAAGATVGDGGKRVSRVRKQGYVVAKPVSEQVVVVVGASSGIGRATALAFARRGATVVAGARSEDGLDTLAGEAGEAAGRVDVIPVDVTDPVQVHEFAQTAAARHGRIDTWVNVAAVTVYGRVEQISPDEYDRVLRVNALGQVHGSLAALPHLRAAGGGVLIGLGSVESYRAVTLHAPYTMSKFAVRAFYDVLRLELAEEGAPVAVTTILPPGVDTPLFEHARTHGTTMPKPPPPVYSPDVVAAAIVRASEHPTREVPVGAAALGFLLAQRFNPALTDALMAAGGLISRLQISTRPDDRRDNVDTPMAASGRTSGRYPGRVFQHSAFTRLIGQRSRPGDLLTRLVRAVQARG